MVPCVGPQSFIPTTNSSILVLPEFHLPTPPAAAHLQSELQNFLRHRTGDVDEISWVPKHHRIGELASPKRRGQSWPCDMHVRAGEALSGLDKAVVAPFVALHL